ncbi:glycoside hydrolase family 13 protein [Saliterribacillus persicus]|uniref:oligo-1,6-glucosidase n=1 Tax=Saliterribacillus persicus TaxID=930114 RepID=A0A368YG63_9BACI|nr:alpha-glucosidase [Saliterribacillus persicus]RCW77174.1 oligo-1,6-glucosidase [Saliterribacillus persicus]
MAREWWKESVVYQIYPRSFRDSNGDGIGDINGIIEKLDYLKYLGIDVIWLSPVYDSPNDDNGYDISNYQAIMDEFGTMEEWETLLAEMHKRDLKLIMDLVVNHTSDEHEWFVEASKSKENKCRNYYFFRPGKNNLEPNNWESVFGGSAWRYQAETDEYFLHLFSKKQPDLNWENPKLRKEIYKMMSWWLDKGIDGFRMDVINFISKDSRLPDGESKKGSSYASGAKYFMNGPKIHDYLQEMHQEVLKNYDIMTVGEMPGATPEEGVLYTDQERKELDMVFHFEHMDIDAGEDGKWDLKDFSLIELKEILNKWQVALEEKGWNSLYWNNHDQPRVVSRFGDDGEYREKSAKMLATTLHFMKGTPYIYQGEEIGMTNVAFDSIKDYRDIETLNMYNEKKADGWSEDKLMQAIHTKSRDNARTPMQWNESSQAGFTTGDPWISVNSNYKKINAEAAIEDENSIFHYYRKLITLRKTHDIVVDGKFNMLEKDNDALFVYTRELNNQQMLVISNFTSSKQHYSLPAKSFEIVNSELLISNTELDVNNEKEIVLSPYETRVYFKK